jgi:hypothetical protein
VIPGNRERLLHMGRSCRLHPSRWRGTARETRFPISLTLLVLAATVSAAEGATPEGTISDLRLGFYGMGSEGTKDAETKNATTDAVISSTTSSDDLASHGRVSISYIGGKAKPVGLIYGIGLALDAAEYEWDNGDSQSWSGFIVDFNLGAAVALGSNFHAEAAGVLGFGSGTVEYDVVGATVDPADAVVVEWGLRFGVYGTMDKLQVGLEAGWMSTNYVGAEWELTGLNRTYTEDTEMSGTYIGLTIGARL